MCEKRRGNVLPRFVHRRQDLLPSDHLSQLVQCQLSPLRSHRDQECSGKSEFLGFCWLSSEGTSQLAAEGNPSSPSPQTAAAEGWSSEPARPCCLSPGRGCWNRGPCSCSAGCPLHRLLLCSGCAGCLSPHRSVCYISFAASSLGCSPQCTLFNIPWGLSLFPDLPAATAGQREQRRAQGLAGAEAASTGGSSVPAARAFAAAAAASLSAALPRLQPGRSASPRPAS